MHVADALGVVVYLRPVLHAFGTRAVGVVALFESLELLESGQ